MHNIAHLKRFARTSFTALSLMAVIAASAGSFFDIQTAQAAPLQLTQITEAVQTDRAPNSYSYLSDMTPDGRYIAFSSSASNLVEGDTNNQTDVFLYDTWIGSTKIISVNNSGTPGTNDSGRNSVSISDDARYVLFDSSAENLIDNDENFGYSDIFVRDLQNNTTQAVSLDENGAQFETDTDTAKLSGNGRFVVFESYYPDVVSGDTNDAQDIFVRSLDNNTTVRASVTDADAQIDYESTDADISADGRYVSFITGANGVTSDDTVDELDVFRRDLVNNETTLISVPVPEINSDDPNMHEAAISGDGNIIAFASTNANLVANDTNSDDDVFVRNVSAGTTTKVSIQTDGIGSIVVDAGYQYSDIDISANGNYVTFVSEDTPQLVTGDDNNRNDVFIHGISEDETYRMSLGVTGIQRSSQSNNDSSRPSKPSDDGSKISFRSYADNLLEEADENGYEDIFFRNEDDGNSKRKTVQLGIDGDYVPVASANENTFIGTSSSSGRYVVFSTKSTNIVPGTEIGYEEDIVLYDRQTGVYELINVDSNEVQPEDGGERAIDPSVSDDGRYVVFASGSSQLVDDDEDTDNTDYDVFMRDRVAGTTERISVPVSGVDVDYADSTHPQITPDGRFVVFTANGNASTLVAGDTNGYGDVFLWDRLAGGNKISLISVSDTEVAADQNSSAARVSDDGNFVAFISSATNLTAHTEANDNSYDDVFVRNISAGTTSRVTFNLSQGITTNGSTTGHGAVDISNDGNLVVFTVEDDLLEGADTNGYNDVYVYNIATDTYARASVGDDESQGNNDSTFGTISADGRYVVFQTLASNFDAGDTNSRADVYRRDLINNATERVSVTPDPENAQSPGDSTAPYISRNGLNVVFLKGPGGGGSVSLYRGASFDEADPQYRDLFFATYDTPMTAKSSVKTTSASDITDDSATINGDVIDDGGAVITERGFEWGLTSSYGTNIQYSGSFGEGTFSSGLSGLECDTDYHYRAYAVNSQGTTYGNDRFVTTAACEESGSDSAPTVTSSAATDITQTTATLNGNITDAGSPAPETRGFEYGLDATYGDMTSESGSYAAGAFSLPVTGLTCETTYHFRAYASNTEGTGNGSDLTFTTTACDGTPPGSGTTTGSQAGTSVDGGYVGAHPNGTLLLDGQTIYLVKDRMRYGFRDPEEYRSYGYNFDQTVLANLADQSRLSVADTILKAMPGSLVLDKTDGRTVYMIGADHTKRGFASEKIFTDLGYNYTKLFSIDLSDYATGAVINSADQVHPEGSLVREKDLTVWWLLNGQRSGFESEQVFNTYGFSPSRLVKASDLDLSVSVGPLVKLRDGTLVQDDGFYFIISDGKKMQFASTRHLELWGYKLSNVINADIDRYEVGTFPR